MSTLTKPQGSVAIGWAIVQGQRVPVTIDIEWDRFLSVLTARAGGVAGVSTTEIVESAFEDAGINEMQAMVFANENGQNQRPPEVFMESQDFDNAAELRARIDALETMVKELQQVPT